MTSERPFKRTSRRDRSDPESQLQNVLMNSIVKQMPEPRGDWKPDNEWNAEFKSARRWVDLVAWFVAAVGLIDLVEGLIPREPRVIEWMAQFLPVGVFGLWRPGHEFKG